MTAFTRLGSFLWDWEPWTELDERGRILWLALYMSAEAKRNVPGLWHGGLPTMADAARMLPDNVRYALDALLERDLVEYDPKVRVLRLCALPDPGERPSNGNVIRSWWTRFQSVPDCAVRNAHVKTLEWILQEGSKRSRKEISHDHVQAWNGTFATVVIPAPRRRGLRRLCDNDTSTAMQPSLFGAANREPVSPRDGEHGGSVNPQGERDSVDNSAALRQSNEIRGPETVSQTVPGTVSETNRIPDPGSRIPDLSSIPESGEGVQGGRRAVLTLVPQQAPYTAADVYEVMAGGLWDPDFDKPLQIALGAMIAVWCGQGTTLDDFRVLSDYSRHSGQRRNARWLIGCDMPAEIGIARRVLAWRDVRAQDTDAAVGDG